MGRESNGQHENNSPKDEESNGRHENNLPRVGQYKNNSPKPISATRITRQRDGRMES